MANKPATVGNGRWVLGKRLGAGSFGEIYACEDTLTSAKFAVKLEDTECKAPQLLTEAKILRHLQGVPGIPLVMWYGTEERFNILVMTMLGPSLEDVLNTGGRRISTRGTVQAAEEMIQRLEDVHFRDYIHRDIKPDNFLLGRPSNSDSRMIYLIDFGLSKRYRDMRTKVHIACKEEKPLIGTARYASVNTHLGFEQSRRDDLEALGYIFIYLQKGKLPWQGLPRSSRKDKYRGIMEAKMNTPLSLLCKDLPPEFAQFLQYCRMLKFDERPDYAYCRKLMRDVCTNCMFTTVGRFDWEEIPSEPSSACKKNRRTSSARRPLARDKSKATKTLGADVQLTTEPHCGPRISQRTRENLDKLRNSSPTRRSRSNCRVF